MRELPCVVTILTWSQSVKSRSLRVHYLSDNTAMLAYSLTCLYMDLVWNTQTVHMPLHVCQHVSIDAKIYATLANTRNSKMLTQIIFTSKARHPLPPPTTKRLGIPVASELCTGRRHAQVGDVFPSTIDKCSVEIYASIVQWVTDNHVFLSLQASLILSIIRSINIQ